MITSVQNQQVKNILKLKKSGKERRKQGLFVLEGLRLVSEVPREALVKAYATEQYLEQHSFLGEIETVSESVMQQLCDTKTPQGIVAVAKMPVYSLEEILRGGDGILLVLENVQDPGNLGTMIRTGEGAGVCGVLMSKDTVDIFNPKVIRATMGSIFRVPFLYVEDLLELLPKLHEEGYISFAAHLEGKDIYEEDFRKKVAFFIGNEGNGLSAALADQTKKKIKIPMEGRVESLNAAIAASLLIYEARRQRR